MLFIFYRINFVISLISFDNFRNYVFLPYFFFQEKVSIKFIKKFIFNQ